MWWQHNKWTKPLSIQGSMMTATSAVSTQLIWLNAFLVPVPLVPVSQSVSSFAVGDISLYIHQ